MRPVARLALAIVALGAPLALATDFPLAGSRISLKDGKTPAARRVSFVARYTTDLGTMDPNFDGVTLRVYGAPGEGDSGLITLGPNWHTLPKGKGFRYADRTQSAGGIRSVLIRKAKHGGRVKITGGAAKWTYAVAKAQTVVTVTLEIGSSKLCAQFTNPTTKGTRVVGRADSALAACPCEKFDSTWAAIQSVIFERRGCTDAVCHGSAAGAATSGGLNLSHDVAYENLVKVWSVLGQMNRVEPGSPLNDSFLYRKLAIKTLGADRVAGSVPGTPMPQGLAPLSTDELEAIRLWIQYSAKKDGVVAGTEQLLNSCLPPAAPPHIEAPAPPAAGSGVQYYAPKWNLQPKSEDEGCYATYYDVTAQVPDEFKTPCPDAWGGPTKTCYFFNKDELTQEPNSHHSIIHIYRGKYADTVGYFCKGGADEADGMPKACDPSHPGVAAPDGDDCGAGATCASSFNFRCGGTKDGAPCDPRDAATCGSDQCLGVFKTSLACLTYGPPDFGGIGNLTGAGSSASPSVGGSQQPFARTAYPDGVFGVFPTVGTWVWNSHAFNTTDQATYNQQWLNVYFAPPADRVYPIQGIFDAADIFVQNVPTFEEREYCRTLTFGIGTRLFELSSHTHKRGRLFRGWGPGVTPHCRSTKDDPDLCKAETTPPIFTTTQYNDPTQLRFSPPLALDDPNPANRTFKFCAIFDNGYTDPAAVKRNSTSPIGPSFGLANPFGGPCYHPPQRPDGNIACVDGPKRGQLCHGVDANCDDPSSGYTAPPGTCDACILTGGVTTEDEMFIPLGSYYCDPSVPGHNCENGYSN